MARIALYRAWRPQAFRDVVGQKHIVHTLQNALRESKWSHAYLFSGPRGTGKTSVAKIMAKAINCERGPAAEPCNECDACVRITAGAVMDVVEIDAASNRGVEEIRDIRDKVKYAPTEVRQKVYIIDEVHMLTTEAFNALLKTLEEPPEHVMFILATTEPHRLPATILSRCQRFDFRRITLEEQVERLERVCRDEGIRYEPQAIHHIARLSEGGMRDAISLLDQVASYADEELTYGDVIAMTGGVAADYFEQLVRAIHERRMGDALELVDGLLQEGKSADKCLESLMHYFRDLLMIRMVPDSPAVTERIYDPARFAEMSKAFGSEQLFRIIETLNQSHSEMKYSSQPQTLLEVAVLKLCSLPDEAESAGANAPRGNAVVGSSSGNAAGGEAGAGEWAELRQKVAQLEQQVGRLLQGGSAAGGTAPVGTDAGQLPAAAAAPRASAAAAKVSSAMRKLTPRLDGFVQQRQSPLFKQALAKWPQVLAQVKEQRITVHAWLVDGEPVALQDDTLLLTFKSAMHRETTEKPANKQLIGQVMSGVFGHETKLATVMQKDWKDALEEPAEAPGEELKLEPEEPEGSGPKEEWIREAIEMFGDDLVKIKED